MIYITFFCTITLSLLFVTGHRKDSSTKKNVPRKAPDQRDRKSLWVRIFFPISDGLKKNFRRRISWEKEEKIEILLAQAGNPLGMTPIDFRILQVSLIIFLPIIFSMYGIFLQLGLLAIMLLIFIGLIMAIFIPHYYLKLKSKDRNKQALTELPDVVDLLSVSLEAGLGFDLALRKLVSIKSGILALEFHRCLEEIRLGKTRREALKGITQRLTVDEINLLISSILQAEKLGISMVHILRVQSQEIRKKRKQRAEEEAMKAPIKMLFPLILFIFPSLFIVLLGPAIIQILTNLNK